MKKYTLIITFTLGCLAMNAQDFQETKSYILKTETGITKASPLLAKVDILAAEETSRKVATLTLSNLEQYHETRLSVLHTPKLKNIREVLKLELEYGSYSLAIDTYYFLVTEKGGYIALPKITKIYDDITEPIIDYVFPAQKHGREETIVKAIFHYTDNYSTEEIEVIQSIVWNDDDFGSEKVIVGIENH